MVTLSKFDTKVSNLSASSSEHLSETGKRKATALSLDAEGTSLNDGLYGNLNKLFCRCSSVVEHVIGNDGVVSPILTSGTIKNASLVEAFLMVILQESSDLRGQRKSGIAAPDLVGARCRRIYEPPRRVRSV